MLIYEDILAKKHCRMGISTSLSEYETKISYHTALLVVGNIASAAAVSCL